MSTVYVKLARAFNFGDALTIGTLDNVGKLIQIQTPTTGVPNDPYFVNVWDVDLNSSDYESPFTANQVVQCSTGSPLTVGADFVMDFYDE